MNPPDTFPPEPDQVEPSEMVLQLISSMRSIDGMLDILTEMVSENKCKNKFKEELNIRIERLLQTRHCINHSMMVIRPSLAKLFEVGEDSVLASDSALYDAIKRCSVVRCREKTGKARFMEKLNKFLSNKYVSTVGIGLNILIFFATNDKYLKVTSLLSISGFVLGILARHISDGSKNK